MIMDRYGTLRSSPDRWERPKPPYVAMWTGAQRHPAKYRSHREHLQHFSDTLTIAPIRRVARGARFRRSVDRNYGGCELNPLYRTSRGADGL